jgi:hypothetical protein
MYLSCEVLLRTLDKVDFNITLQFGIARPGKAMTLVVKFKCSAIIELHPSFAPVAKLGVPGAGMYCTAPLG